MRAGAFHKISRIDDSRLEALFGREVLADLVRKELLSREWAERILSFRQSEFSVHSRVRAKAKTEAERTGKYMIRPLLSLERLSLDEKQGQVYFRYGEENRTTNYLKMTFVAERPPPPHLAFHELLMAAESSAEYLS